MKKFLKIFTLTILAGLAGLCGEVKAQSGIQLFDKKQQKSSKVLIVYFSVTERTRLVAERMSETLGYDFYRIRPQKPYIGAELDFNDSASRVCVEAADSTIRPAIAGQKIDLSNYSAVFIGFPIWFNSVPKVIRTFIESYNLSGKTLIPFATCAGSTIDMINSDLQRWYPKYEWKEGRVMNLATREQIMSWNKELSLKLQ